MGVILCFEDLIFLVGNREMTDVHQILAIPMYVLTIVALSGQAPLIFALWKAK